MIATDLVCADCGGRLVYRTTGKYGPWYACERWPGCPGAIGAHPDGSPLGTPADTRTRKARTAAHEVFDALWKPGSQRNAKIRRRRKRAYAALGEFMELSKDECHIGMFDANQCARVIEFANAYRCLAR